MGEIRKLFYGFIVLSRNCKKPKYSVSCLGNRCSEAKGKSWMFAAKFPSTDSFFVKFFRIFWNSINVKVFNSGRWCGRNFVKTIVVVLVCHKSLKWWPSSDSLGFYFDITARAAVTFSGQFQTSGWSFAPVRRPPTAPSASCNHVLGAPKSRSL